MPLIDDPARFAARPLLPTNLDGALSIPFMPPGFDPHRASLVELHAHGFPWLRPRVHGHPHVRETWARALGERWRAQGQIVPRLQVLHRPRRGAPVVRAPLPADQFSPSWSGVVVPGAFDLAVSGNVSVTGQWIVPTVSRPANNRPTGPILGEPGARGWDSSSWVGIDGFAPESSDVLQAGIQHFVRADGEAVYRAWFEWFVPQFVPGDPDYVYPVTITNFDVRPGDEVSCNVAYVNRQYGTISFSNLRTGAWFSISLTPPSNASFNARFIEWIFEAPGGGWSQGVVVPDFTPVVFANAFGCGGGAGDLVDPGAGLKLLLQEGSPPAPLVETAVGTDGYSLTVSQR
jgi:hypothetical protein